MRITRGESGSIIVKTIFITKKPGGERRVFLKQPEKIT
jgi:hypothetical protein